MKLEPRAVHPSGGCRLKQHPKTFDCMSFGMALVWQNLADTTVAIGVGAICCGGGCAQRAGKSSRNQTWRRDPSHLALNTALNLWLPSTKAWKIDVFNHHGKKPKCLACFQPFEVVQIESIENSTLAGVKEHADLFLKGRQLPIRQTTWG